MHPPEPLSSPEALHREVQALQMQVQALEAQLQQAHAAPQNSRETSIKTLAAGIAHEFNNLLGPILMAAETLKRTAPDEKSRHRLTFIERNARRGAEIVQHLIAYEKGAKGHHIPLDLCPLLHQAQPFIQGTLSPAVSFRTDVPSALPTIHGDAAQIQQMLQHLFRNAGEAMPTGGTLILQAAVCPPPLTAMPGLAPAATYVCITVSDTGRGIPLNHVPYIFDPFFTTKVRGQSTGLGLTAVASIMKGHQGGITVESQENQGTRFTLYFPVPPTPLSTSPVVIIDESDDLFSDDFAWDDP